MCLPYRPSRDRTDCPTDLPSATDSVPRAAHASGDYGGNGSGLENCVVLFLRRRSLLRGRGHHRRCSHRGRSLIKERITKRLEAVPCRRVNIPATAATVAATAIGGGGPGASKRKKSTGSAHVRRLLEVSCFLPATAATTAAVARGGGPPGAVESQEK
jgi:hypothetical protein